MPGRPGQHVGVRGPRRRAAALAALAACLAGCASYRYREPAYDLQVQPGTVLRLLRLEGDLEEKILALNPHRIREADVREVLARAPAPRIINLHGSVPIVTMKSFSGFLIAMGYPAGKVRDPRTGSYTYSSYVSSRRLAGSLAWYYEKEGLAPMLIGHSQGGMKVVEVLHVLSGDLYGQKVAVWNPVTDRAEGRHTFVDPRDGVRRPVVGLKLGFAAAVGTGKLMRVLLGQWGMLSRLRKIPDTVEEFTGLSMRHDPIGGGLYHAGRSGRYRPLNEAFVRNVALPGGYGHFRVVLTEHLAESPAARRWINAYVPTSETPEIEDELAADCRNILFAAEMWYSIKRHWCLDLQRCVHARRKMNLPRR